MVKHIILWTLQEMDDDEKERVKAGIKEGLEGLKGRIPGLVDITVNAGGRLETSTVDLMLDSTFESAAACGSLSSGRNHSLFPFPRRPPATKNLWWWRWPVSQTPWGAMSRRWMLGMWQRMSTASSS